MNGQKHQNFRKSMLPTCYKTLILHLQKSPLALRGERMASMVKSRAHDSAAIMSLLASGLYVLSHSNPSVQDVLGNGAP